MKRRTLDITFSVGGLVLAGLLLVLGLVLQNQANFADSYVKHQLSSSRSPSRRSTSSRRKSRRRPAW